MDLQTLKRQLHGVLDISAESTTGLVGGASGARVWIDLVPGARTHWLVMRTVICGLPEMDPCLSLERNGLLAHAAIVLCDEEYRLRVAIPTDSVEAIDPATLLLQLLTAAQSLRPRVAPTAIDPRSLFAHYAD